MKLTLIAAVLATLISSQAQASWAENANKNYPVFTGTNASLARAQGHRYYRHSVRRHYYAHRSNE